MPKSLNALKQDKRNKRLCKVLSVVFVVFMILSTVMTSVSAATNVWGVDTTQIDKSYFYNLGMGGSCYNSWYITRQRCFYTARLLADSFNGYIVDTDINNNVLKQFNVCYTRNLKTEADVLKNRWNNLRYQIQEAMTDTGYLCGSSEGIRYLVSGDSTKAVTEEQYQNLLLELNQRNTELEQLTADIKSLYSYALIAGDNASVNAINNSKSLINELWARLGSVIIDFGSGYDSTTNFLGISVDRKSVV